MENLLNKFEKNGKNEFGNKSIIEIHLLSNLDKGK